MRRKIETVVAMPIAKRGNVSERIRHHAQQKQLWDDTEILLRQKESGSEPACTFSFIPMKLLFHAYETSVPCRGNFSFMPMKLKIHADKILQI